MSYQTIEYRIIPTESYKIIRKCGGCGDKKRFISTKNFRVNANGNCLDVWLIYQCEKCKHTYNLPIYSRIQSKRINQKEYKLFLANDEELAYKYGTRKELFAANHVEISEDDVKYEISRVDSQTICKNVLTTDVETEIIVHNLTGIGIRKEKILAEIMNISRSAARKLLDEERVLMKIEAN